MLLKTLIRTSQKNDNKRKRFLHFTTFYVTFSSNYYSYLNNLKI